MEAADADARVMAQHLCAPAILLGLARTSMGLWLQGRDFFSQQDRAQPSGLGWDTGHLGTVLCFRSNKSCHNTAPPPMHVSLKCVSCDTMKESCLHQQQGELKVSRERGQKVTWRLSIYWGKEGGPLNARGPECKAWDTNNEQKAEVGATAGRSLSTEYTPSSLSRWSCSACRKWTQERGEILADDHWWEPADKVLSLLYTTCLPPRAPYKLLDFLLQTWAVHYFMNLVNPSQSQQRQMMLKNTCWASPCCLPTEPGIANALPATSSEWAVTDSRNYTPIRTTQLCFRSHWFSISHQKQLSGFQYCYWFALMHIKVQSMCCLLRWKKTVCLAIQSTSASFREQSFPWFSDAWGNEIWQSTWTEDRLALPVTGTKRSQRTWGILET